MGVIVIEILCPQKYFRGKMCVTQILMYVSFNKCVNIKSNYPDVA